MSRRHRILDKICCFRTWNTISMLQCTTACCVHWRNVVPSDLHCETVHLTETCNGVKLQMCHSSGVVIAEPGPKRPTVGKAILLPDLEYGGLRTETHGNFTLGGFLNVIFAMFFRSSTTQQRRSVSVQFCTIASFLPWSLTPATVVGKFLLSLSQGTTQAACKNYAKEEKKICLSDRTVTDGELFVEIFYNGKELFKNHFPLCTAEDCKCMNSSLAELGKELSSRLGSIWCFRNDRPPREFDSIVTFSGSREEDFELSHRRREEKICEEHENPQLFAQGENVSSCFPCWFCVLVLLGVYIRNKNNLVHWISRREKVLSQTSCLLAFIECMFLAGWTNLFAQTRWCDTSKPI